MLTKVTDNEAVLAVLSMAGNVLTMIQAPTFLASLTTAIGIVIAALWIAKLHMRLIAENKHFRSLLANAEKKEQALQLSSDAISDFLTRIAHEMRRPLEGFVTYAALALKTDVASPQRECLDRVMSDAASLTRIVSNVLDFMRMDASYVEVASQKFSLPSCILTAVRTLEDAAIRKHLELSYRLDPQLPPEACGDPHRLQQILVNLLENAISYTTAGSVVLSANIISQTDETFTLCVAIADTGIGIAMEDHARIFEPFQTGSNVKGGTSEAAGLGLSICKRLVALLNGEIEVQSQIGAGSTFRFTVVLGKVRPPEDGADGSDLLNRLELKRLAILLADEDVATRRLTTKLLESSGHQISPAGSAGEALALFSTDIFDVVFLSTSLPDMRGLALAHALRKLDEEMTRTQMYALRAENDPTASAAYLTSGLDGVVPKPVHVEHLQRALNKAAEARAAVNLNS